MAQGRRVQLRGPGRLTVVEGPQLGLVYRVGEQALVLGRGRDADIEATGDGVSRHHAQLVRNATGSVKLVDLGSANGTFVNEMKVTSAVLDDGDRIRIGQHVFDFAYEHDDDRETVDLATNKLESGKRTSTGSVSDRLLTTVVNLGEVHRAAGRYADALTAYQRALAGLDANPRADRRRLAEILVAIGECHLGLSDHTQADPPLQRAVDILEQLGVHDRLLSAPRFALALARARTDLGRARQLAQLARSPLDANAPAEHDLVGRIDRWLAGPGGAG